MNNAYILACARSPMTKSHKGALSFIRIDDVAAEVIRGLLTKVPALDTKQIEDVIIGCAMPEGEQGLNVARNISLLAGLPITAGAVTVNRFCASSLEAINLAAKNIWSDNGDLFLVGGIESMTHVPMGGFNPSLNEKLMQNGAPEVYISMGLTAENVAKKYSITREEQDKFALTSHRKAVAAKERGKFNAEIVPIKSIARDEKNIKIAEDDGPRADTSLDALSKLSPAFLKGGTVTAGNSSPLTDGAVMMLIASERFAKKNKIKPLAKIVAMGLAGVNPAFMGIGPVEAIPKALAKVKMKLKNIDLVELNEAFAAQALAVVRELHIEEKKLNVNGGAIALGHPLGMSGARIMTTLIHALIDRNLSTGLASLCVGGGQGVATIIERV